MDSKLSGPVNVAGPTPATSDQITEAFAARHAPPVSAARAAFAVKLLGEAGSRLLLDDAKVVPTRLQADGFAWKHPTITDAVIAGRVAAQRRIETSARLQPIACRVAQRARRRSPLAS